MQLFRACYSACMKRIWIAASAVAGVLLAGFAYYAVSPLFISIEADESVPASSETVSGARAPIVDTPAHPASGTVRVISADGKTYVRYENYETINGPDIFVYLSKDLEATDFVNLGRVKATKGNVNYEVPSHIDISEYRYVLTWCKAFGVLFNYADLGY